MIQLTDEQRVTLHAQPVTEGGNPAGIDGPVTWSVSDPALVTLNPNGFDCEVVTNGPLGTAVVTVEGDADLGAGVTLINGSVDIEVIAAPAVSINITNDAPELKP